MELGKLVAGPSLISKTTSGANAIGTVTVTGKAGLAIYVLGLTLSTSAAPAATVTVTLKDGSTIILPIELPAATIQPISYNFDGHPLQITTGADAVFSCPALGGATISSISMRYMWGSP